MTSPGSDAAASNVEGVMPVKEAMPVKVMPVKVMLVKLGGSLITDKRGSEAPRPEVMARLAAELAEGLPAARERGLAVVLGHGSGSFGHVAAAEHGIVAGLGDDPGDERARRLAGASATQGKAAQLHHLLLAELRRAGLAPFSIAPSSALVAARRDPAHLAAEPLALALAAGFLPVVYGDLVTDREQGVAICSTEAVFQAVTGALPEQGFRVAEALWLGETAGVYDEAGETIPEIAAGPSLGAPAGAAATAGAAEGTDVTGGMAHRLETALALAAAGVPSRIADGTEPGLLARALAGEEVAGTRVVGSGPGGA